MIFTKQHRDEPTDGAFWRQRGWIASASFLVVVMVIAAATWLGDAGNDAAAPPPDEATEPLAAARRLRGDERPEGCRAAAPGSTIPVAQPPDVQWRDLPTGRLPLSPTAGPTRADGDIMWCFARNPTGAAMAAHVIPAQMSGDSWRKAAEYQIVPGLPRDLFVRLRSTVPPRLARSGTAGTFAGFAVIDYTPDLAVIQLLIQSGQTVGSAGGYSSTQITLTWNGGDWKVLPDNTGSLYTPLVTETQAAGYVMWNA